MIPARSMPTTTALRRAYFHDIKSPVQVDITRARAVAAKNIFIGSGLGAGEAGVGAGDFEASGLGASTSARQPCGRGGGRLVGREVQGSILMQLRKMNENRGRNIRTPTARLVQSEHLKASRNGEEEDRRRKEHSNVMVR